MTSSVPGTDGDLKTGDFMCDSRVGCLRLRLGGFETHFKAVTCVAPEQFLPTINTGNTGSLGAELAGSRLQSSRQCHDLGSVWKESGNKVMCYIG